MKGRLRSNPSNRPVGASAGGCISLQGVRLGAHRENAHIPPLSEISKGLRGSALVAPQTQEIFFPESRTFGFLLSFGAAKGLLHGAISSSEWLPSTYALLHTWSEPKCDLPRRYGRDELDLAGQLAETPGRKPWSGNLAIFLQLPPARKDLPAAEVGLQLDNRVAAMPRQPLQGVGKQLLQTFRDERPAIKSMGSLYSSDPSPR